MPPKQRRPFDAQAFLESAGLGKRMVTCAPGQVLFSQGDPSDTVMYLRSGEVRLSVLSHRGREAIVATLGPGDFLGEGAIAGHPVRLETATATLPSTVLVIARQQMTQLLHSEHELSDRFIAHMLARNARLEADLVDQLFNSSEKRLARASDLGQFRQGETGKDDHAEDRPGDAGEFDRHDPRQGQPLHE